jgi:hypothetical protein
MTAGIIIAVIAVVVILIGIRFVQGPTKVTLSPEQMKKMQETGRGAPTTAFGRAPVSAPPAGAMGMGK